MPLLGDEPADDVVTGTWETEAPGGVADLSPRLRCRRAVSVERGDERAEARVVPLGGELHPPSLLEPDSAFVPVSSHAGNTSLVLELHKRCSTLGAACPPPDPSAIIRV